MPRRFDRETNFGQEEWQKSALARIDWLAATGLPPLKTETLRVLVAQEKLRRSTQLCLAARLDLLTASYQSNLLGGNRLGPHEAAIFLPESQGLKQAEETATAISGEFADKLYNLALMRLREDKAGQILEEAARQSAIDMLGKTPLREVVSIWEITYNALSGRESYELNLPTRTLSEQIRTRLDGSHPPSSVFCAALLHYGICLLESGGVGEESIPVVTEQVTLSSNWFLETHIKETFPDGWGDIFGN